MMRKVAPKESPPPDPVARDVQRLIDHLSAVGRRQSLRDPMFAICEEQSLTPPQAHSLLWLGHDDSLPMGELSRRVGITEKTMTGIVDRLEAAGHVVRERDVADRRVVHVKLTPGGRALHDRIDTNVRRAMAGFLSLLETSEREVLFGLLTKIEKRLAQSGPNGNGEDS